MTTKSMVVAKTHIRNIKLAYVITACWFLATILQDIVFLALHWLNVFSGNEDNMTVGLGNVLYLIIILGAVFIPSMNFRKMMNLGGKRADFFWGSAMGHVIMAAAVSLAGMILYYTYESFVISVYYKAGNLNVLFWFGWINNGAAIAFVQQFAFLLLLAVFVHTLTSVQDKWYGWVADIAIVAIIAVFTPIAPLRAALVWFFRMIIFHPNAFAQIVSCLVLSAAIYALNKPILARRTI